MIRLASPLFAAAFCLAQAPSKEAPVISAEPSAFREVTAKLDPGGSLYAYMSTDQWLAGLSGKVAEWRKMVLGLPGMGDSDREQIGRVFQLAENLIRHSGLESLSGVGLSGIAVEKGLYRTRFVGQRAAGSPDGYFWQWFGTQPHPLGALDWLPADTVWTFFGDTDLAAVWKAVEKEGVAAGFEPVAEGMKALSAQVEQVTGRPLGAHLESYGGELGLALVLDSATRIKVPLPGGEKEFPEPSLVIALRMKDDQLFDWLDKVLSDNPQSTRGEADGARWRTIQVPAELPFPVRPTVGRAGDYLWIASSDSLFERVRKVKAGGAPGLKGTAEFQRLSRGLALSGNSFAYMSDRFAETLLEVQKLAMEQAAAQGGGDFPMEFFQKLSGLGGKPASFGVGWVDASGMQSVTQGTQEPATVLVSSVAVAPLAIGAGMVFPAMAQAKGRAQDVMCINNLKQIALGLLMYANDHDDTFPASFSELKEYLGNTPAVFFCPDDPTKPADVRSLDWDDFKPGDCSYEFLKPGLKSADIDPEMVVARCKFHGHEAYADGSVHRAGSR